MESKCFVYKVTQRVVLSYKNKTKFTLISEIVAILKISENLKVALELCNRKGWKNLGKATVT